MKEEKAKSLEDAPVASPINRSNDDGVSWAFEPVQQNKDGSNGSGEPKQANPVLVDEVEEETPKPALDEQEEKGEGDHKQRQ